ncbi:delta(1)-pyrroline-2-carboxylate reductase [Thalassobacillus devorans]|uniref:Delta(1)-pyrroline-2-carboxylate reductase n=1 Tax=Thalassobacillus devorans TaxID=279813 RepID=A0ABQ1PTZ4_9BACI|nr:NAD(P)-binding domain-containing protein [Thalassobacillus devorans]NIK30696.1 ornithine cyclodeaminase [Thalassobacillus devorans]GGD03076.1 delta(1)-pyrroline-2-carboxylate reductase [Thalassobacillus devorans]
MEVITAEEIKGKFSMKETMEAIESFYKEKQEGYISPDRMHIEDGNNTALLMPAFYDNYYATKLVGVAPSNTGLNKDTIHGLMILYNRETMEPLFLCDAIAITSLRTGALGGLGMKYLAKEDAKTLGIIGTGTQGWSHLQSGLATREIENVYIFNRTEKKAHDFKKRAEAAFPSVTFHVTSVEDLVKKSDIIVTTTTSTQPVLPELEPSQWKGKLIVGVGSFRPDMQEISDQVLSEADEIYVDAASALHESGDMIQAKDLRTNLDNAWDLEKIIQENHRPVDVHNKSIVFKSVGASIFDLVAVKAIYETYYK